MKNTLVDDIQKFIKRFSWFDTSSFDYSLPLALWVIGTQLYTDFDAYPYLVITSATKRSGKTRLSEILSFISANPVSSGAMTPASMFKTMADERPTIFIDEAESLSSEAASNMRTVLNMGYRKGQKVRRVKGEQVMEYEVYCPKVFVLIGDVYDTLKDRSIIVRMRRATVAVEMERFVFEPTKAEGAVLRDRIAEWIEENHSALIDSFVKFQGIDFLTDRDEEIWTPLFVICQMIAPEKLAELQRLAVDIATEKTQDSRRYTELENQESKIADDEYATRLLRDVCEIVDGKKYLPTSEILEKLRAIPTAPWRVYKGEGITMHSLATMLSRFGVAPRSVQTGKGRKDRKVSKGYWGDELRAALKSN